MLVRSEFKNNERNGYGTWTKDGNVYVGTVNNGIPDGKGEFTWSNGKKYTGEWNNGQPNGVGTMTYKDGSVYEGNVLQGIKHGKGVLKLVNGDTYDGYWNNNKKEGQIMISGLGKATIMTTWKDNKIVSVDERAKYSIINFISNNEQNEAPFNPNNNMEDNEQKIGAEIDDQNDLNKKQDSKEDNPPA